MTFLHRLWRSEGVSWLIDEAIDEAELLFTLLHLYNLKN